MLVLDMDGVLVDFCQAAFKTHDKAFYPDASPTKFDFFDDWDMSASDFWKAIDDQGADFWANLQDYSWASTLIDIAKDWPSGFMVATSCSLHHHSSAGKVIAIKRLFGDKFRDYALIPRKWHLAQPGYLLLDDHEENCNEWEKRGGEAILFPQPWNKNRYLIPHRVEWIVERLATSLLVDDCSEDYYASL